MTEAIKDLMGELGQLAASRARAFVPEVFEQMVKETGRGASELSSALFTGHAFVLYGHGGSSSAPEIDAKAVEPQQVEPQQAALEPQQQQLELSRGRD